MSADSEVNFHIDLNLQRLAMMAWSASFWNRTHVKHKIQKMFGNGAKFNDKKPQDCLKVLIPEAKNELKEWNLPSEMYDRFIQIVISFGLRVIYWYAYLCLDVFFDCRYTGALHWTVYGTIDQAKIVEKWLERFHTSGDEEEKNYWESNRFMLYYMASSSALKDYINLHAEEIVNFCLAYEDKLGHLMTGANYTRSLSDKTRIDYILCAVLTLANTEEIQNYIPSEKKKELSEKYFDNVMTSKEARMLSWSINEGHRAAVQYYWHRLDPINQEKKILTSALQCMKGSTVIHLELNLHRHDIFAFLLMQMTGSQMAEFFETLCERSDGRYNSFKCILTLVNSCAWEEYFFPVLEMIKGHVHFDFTLILRIMDTYANMCKLGLDSKVTVYRKMFLRAWEVMKNDLTWFVKKNSPKLFEIFDINILNAILNDTKWEDKDRKSLLLTGIDKYKNLIENNQFDLLDTFVKTILKSEEERKWFKKELRFFDHFILKEKLDVVGNLLDWLSCSAEERKTLKHSIDILSHCARYFGEKKFSAADKILNWAFPNAEEKSEYINNLEAKELKFLSELFYKNRKKFIGKLSKFLNWFFDSETEVTKFKTEKIASEQNLLNFFKKLNKRPEEMGNYGCLVGRDALATLDDLIKFCLPPESINKLKLEISENIGDWLFFLSVKHCCWGRSDNFLNWIFGYQTAFRKKETILNYKDKQDLVKKILFSPNGMELFKEILLSDHYNTFNKKYFSLWIKWSKDIEKIESYIDELVTSIPGTTNDINENFEDFKNMLLDLKKGEEDPSSIMEHVCFRQLQLPLPSDF